MDTPEFTKNTKSISSHIITDTQSPAMERALQFVTDQLEIKPKIKPTRESPEHFEDQYAHALGIISLFKKKVDNGQIKKGLIILAEEEGKVVGVSTTALEFQENTPEPAAIHLGVSFKNRGEGIGVSLAIKRAEILKSLGYSYYFSSVNKGSEAVLKKAGLDYEIIKENETSKRVKVSI